ncbi:PTI1-like tyrosine-protein kinase 1 isoform X2 [Olea europaea var. sylvestris]|uniref:Serine threonine- kinase CDL1-like isoform X1 n=2 Tax=Olea europaea subsp. europaea TaxID=158383 RepID=A0A8S0TNA7_OLEEU|nr:PTI1-like tyrosine-protein kinase 1 isoform X2 [Olea europaea var. sylvestris]CAA3006306.1 serine threonine- kinase CDL1-like isoform X1 [Olea europaea subsp. europaea]
MGCSLFIENQSMMFGNPKINKGIFSLLGTRTVKRRIIVGLKSDHSSREMLLRLLNSVVVTGDYVLAVHVQESDDTFDPNTFYIHEDLCKSKQVDFEVKVCPRNCYIAELSHQVRINFATILAVGCTSLWPKDSTIAKCLKALPPTCTLLVMDNGGKILFQKEGSSQEGSSIKLLRSSQEGSSIKVIRSSLSCLSVSNNCDQPGTKPLFQKSSSMPCSSTSSKPQQNMSRNWPIAKKNLQGYDVATPELFHRLATLEVKGYTTRYTFDELKCATQNFSPEMLIGEGGHSQVYRAVFNNDQAVAVKVLKSSRFSEEDLFREVDISSGLSHENMIHLLGYCYCKEIRAIVYNLLSSSLKQRLKQLSWKERMQVAVGVARALEYLHSFYPPIIHRDVKSSNILLSEDCKPRLSDFGAAIVHQQTLQSSAYAKPINVVGTFGYLAPEYMMYGKVDEKIDVYSYGVVLLELITGKEAIQSNSPSNRESLVLWARSLLTCGLCERLIDPDLKEDYDKDEMKTMMIAARLCLLHSSSRRPTMKTILHLFEEPEHWLEMHKKREDLPGALGQGEMDDSDPHDFWVIYDK